MLLIIKKKLKSFENNLKNKRILFEIFHLKFYLKISLKKKKLNELKFLLLEN